MNTEYKKILLESLEKVHQSINQATPEQLPNLVHAEVEILTMFENADQAVKANQSLNRLIDEVKKDFAGSSPELQSELDALRDELGTRVGR